MKEWLHFSWSFILYYNCDILRRIFIWCYE